MLDSIFNKMSKGATVVFYLICIFTFFNTCNSCNTKRQVKSLILTNDSLISTVDSLKTTVNTAKDAAVSPIDIEIAGLEAELRMIESCDRKIWDLNRQKVIRRELDSLKLKKYSLNRE